MDPCSQQIFNKKVHAGHTKTGTEPPPVPTIDLGPGGRGFVVSVASVALLQIAPSLIKMIGADQRREAY